MRKAIILSLLLCIYTKGIAQENKQSQEIKTDNDRIEQLNSTAKALEQKLLERDKLYDEHLKRIQEERIKFIDYIESNLFFLKWFISVIALILGIIITFFEITRYKNIQIWLKEKEKTIKNEIDTTVSRLLSGMTQAESETIRTIIKYNEIDELLKKRLKITIVSMKDISEYPSLKKILYSNFNAENISFIIANNGFINKIKKYKPDIIFINNISNDFNFKKPHENPDEINHILTEFEEKGIFYYTNTEFWFSAGKKIELYNFSNSFATLYDQLLKLARLYYSLYKCKLEYSPKESEEFF
jgi:hypothetical protein